MSDSMHSTILRRMTGQQADTVAEAPLTSSRAMRLALAKSANDTVGLALTVTEIAEEEITLDVLLENLPEKLLLIELIRDGAMVGVMAVDMQFRAAVLEMQTMGELIKAVAEERAPTGTDKTMCEPVLERFLSALPAAIKLADIGGWVDDIILGNKVDSSRAAGLVLKDVDYRFLRIGVDLDVADRRGELLIALPVGQQVEIEEAPPVEVVGWDSQFQENVAVAPTELSALLHRFDLPISQAQALQVDQVLPLSGCTVNSIQLMSSDGQLVAQAKLGQLGGKRAVRIEAAPLPQMQDLAGTQGITSLPDMDDGGGLMQESAPDFASDFNPEPPAIGGGDNPLGNEDSMPLGGEDAVPLGGDSLMEMPEMAGLGDNIDMASLDFEGTPE